MRLAVSSASFATAFAVVFKPYSNSVMASAVDAAYENKVKQADDVHIKSRSLGEECSFVSSGLHGKEADTGILGCAEDFVCVEDERSSLGGHCVSVHTEHRHLQTCTKCADNACDGLSQDFKDNKIGAGSCCGHYACKGIDEGEPMCLLLSILLSL